MVKRNSKTPTEPKKRKSRVSSDSQQKQQQKQQQQQPKPPSNARRCAPTGQEMREDLAPASQASFGPLSLEIRYPDTAILLLEGSAERPVLLAAAGALARYGEKARGNLERLFDLNIVDGVLPLVRHEDVFTRRFALKLLALMSAVRNVQAHLLRDDTCIAYFTETLAAEEDEEEQGEQESDVFVLEFASRILAELTSDPRGSAAYLDRYGDAGPMLRKLRSDDPDVRKNCLEVVVNLLKDFAGLEAVYRSKDFSFEAIYELLREPYPVVQRLALEALELLVAHGSSEDAQEGFRASGGPRRLLDVFDNPEWRDLFGQVVRVLSLSCENPRTAELVNSTDGTSRLFAFAEDRGHEDSLRFQVLGVLVRLADSAAGKKILHNLGFVDLLLDNAEDALPTDVRALVCHGLAKMTRYPPSAAEIASRNPLNYAIHLLSDDRAAWPDRQAAAFALGELLATDYRNCVNFLEWGGQVHLSRLIEQPTNARVPWEIQATCVQALSAVADYPGLADELVDFDLFSALCSLLDPENVQVANESRIAVCEALARLAGSAEARRVLIRANLHCKIHCLLVRSSSVPVLGALVRLLLVLSSDRHFARLCVIEGCLLHMLESRSASRAVPAWATCIEALLSADLSMKFAYAGRLGLRDVTDDGFHAMRHGFCPFPLLEDLFRLKLCPLQPIYVANFGTTLRTEAEDDEGFDYLSSKCAAFNAARESMRRRSFERGIRVSEGTINAWLELKFGRLQPDPDLAGYLERFEAELAADEKTDFERSSSGVPGLVKTSRVASRARLLGSFVARQLAGTYPSKRPTCLDHQLEVHLRALKERLETSVIPLGLLRVGSYLERALLFKVMADRIGIPASLVRGCYGKSWVEVAAPTVRDRETSCDTEAEICPYSAAAAGWDELPPGYLRANFVVDLMDEPGQLIPIGYPGAERYRERRIVCKFACCSGDNGNERE